MTKKNWDIDLGNSNNEVPLYGRKSISILLGAGFSVPMGYPIGETLNNSLLNFDDSKIDFSADGTLVISQDGTKPEFQMDGVLNVHQRYFEFCKRLIKEYASAHNNNFDYEVFYDFIKADEAKCEYYQRLCNDLLRGNESYEHYLFNVPHIFNQMVARLIKDKNGKSWYDDEPFRINSFDGYNGFLTYLSELSREYVINVHTLNHDLLFESFNNTGFINGNLSDGFDEYGSDYYGNLSLGKRTIHCRLERYTGRYNTAIRLYKLHGSLDYVPFYRQNANGLMVPQKYVKIRYGMRAGDVIKGRKSKIGYDISPFPYHADFLTGTTSKIQRYNEPLLFKKLFKKFKKNLQNAEKLIIIGYGCKDVAVNKIIKENFDYRNKKIFIVDPFAKEGSKVMEFKEELQAKLLRTGINDICKSLFE